MKRLKHRYLRPGSLRCSVLRWMRGNEAAFGAAEEAGELEELEEI